MQQRSSMYISAPVKPYTTLMYTVDLYIPIHRIFLTFFLLPLLWPTSSLGYTHFVTQDTAHSVTTAHWSNKRIPLLFTVDKNTQVFGTVTATHLAKEAGILWKNVPGSQMRVQIGTSPIDIRSSNFLQRVKAGDQEHEIILDKQGEILESLGLDPEYVAGISIPITKANPKGDPNRPVQGEILDAFILINTRYTINAEKTLRLFVHELGHALGLGHSNIVHLRLAEELPIMYFDPNQQSGAVLLHSDDQAGLASLYPSPDFEQHYGAISGRVWTAERKPAFGVAVIATSLTTGPIGTWTQKDGKFYLTGLPPESYSLLVRAIDGSKDVKGMKTDLHVGGIYEKALTQFCPELFNDNMYVQCRFPPSDSTRIEVKAGQTIHSVVIEERNGNPTPSPACIWGSFPQILGLQRTPPSFPQNKRGTACKLQAEPEPHIKYEPPPLEHKVEVIRPDQSSKEWTRNETTIHPTCGCSQSSNIPMFWLFMCGLYFVYRKKKKTL